MRCFCEGIMAHPRGKRSEERTCMARHVRSETPGKRTQATPHALPQAQVHAHALEHAIAHASTRANIHVHEHTHKHMQEHNARTCTHTRPHRHTHRGTHVHTITHTRTHVRTLNFVLSTTTLNKAHTHTSKYTAISVRRGHGIISPSSTTALSEIRDRREDNSVDLLKQDCQFS